MDTQIEGKNEDAELGKQLASKHSAILQNALKLAMLVNRQAMLNELSDDLEKYCDEYLKSGNHAPSACIREYVRAWRPK